MTNTNEKIPDNKLSEEIVYDKKFISRWTDRCTEIRQKYGQQAARDFAKDMFSIEVIRLINLEIERRKGGK